MAKVKVGDKLPDFVYDTPFETGVRLGQTAQKAARTAVLFLRYYGCTMCQYEIHQYAVEYEKIRAAGGQVLVVLQSAPETLREQVKPGELPFDVICDPEQKLYRLLEIAPAAERVKVTDPAALEKIEKKNAAGFQHGKFEGDELQLPATFVVDSALEVVYAHYGVWNGDTPDPDGLVELLK